MSWFDTLKSPRLKTTRKTSDNSKTPDGVWTKCKSCSKILLQENLVANQFVCPECDHHMRLSAKQRVDQLFVDFQEYDADLKSQDPLGFHDDRPYKDRLALASQKTGEKESAIVGIGSLNSKLKVAATIMSFSYMGGSMGIVSGEKVARAFELGLEHNIPVIVVSCSGGARMQEGILSLMQMAKVSALRARLAEKSLAYISILADPTTGGVAASFAMQGDLNIAEPRALIGFAGPRVIEQTIRQTLPEGFQRSEFLLEHGFLDRIVHRHDLKNELIKILSLLKSH